MKHRIIRNQRTGEIVLGRAKWCASHWCRFRGLQFVTKLADDEGLLFVNNSESRAESAIHMFFMFMSIGVIWMDERGCVIDKQFAKPWRPMYAPAAPAKYYIEARPSVLDRVAIGDVLSLHEEST